MAQEQKMKQDETSSKKKKTLLIFSGIILLLVIIMCIPSESSNVASVNPHIDTKDFNTIYSFLKCNDFSVKTDKDDMGFCRWFEKDLDNVNIKIDMFSDNGDDLCNYRVIFNTLSSLKNVSCCKPLAKYYMRVFNNEEDSNKLSEWIESHFDAKRDSIRMGNSQLTICGGSDYVKMLMLDPVIEEEN